MFESSHCQTFISDIYFFTANCLEKTKVKRKRGREWPIFEKPFLKKAKNQFNVPGSKSREAAAEARVRHRVDGDESEDSKTDPEEAIFFPDLDDVIDRPPEPGADVGVADQHDQEAERAEETDRK